MKRPAVFFDRDNTLIANDGYLGDPAQVKLVEGAAEAVAKVRALGYAAVVFSNQSGVARGMFAEEAVHAVNSRLDELLQDHNPGAVIDRHEFCPYHPEASVERYRTDSELRKPKPGMILQAAKQLALDLTRSWVIGDAPRDVEAGRAAGCRTILLKHNGLAASPAALQSGDVTPDHEVTNLHEATAIIESNPPPPTVEDVVIQPKAQQARKISAAAPEIPATSGATEEPASDADKTVTGPESAEAEAPAPERSVLPSGPTAVLATPQREGLTANRAPINLEDDSPVLARLQSLESLTEQVLQELRRANHHTISDFSVSKLLAGIVQILTLAALFFAYLRWDTPSRDAILLVTVVLQTLTISLLIMGRQH